MLLNYSCLQDAKNIKISILLTSCYHLEGVGLKINRTADWRRKFSHRTLIVIENNACVWQVAHTLTMATPVDYEHDSNDVTEICQNKNVHCGEINEQSFNDPHRKC